MRKRHGGFTQFMRQLDGDKEYDNFSETEGLGRGVYQRYEWILKLLRGDICWGTYAQRMHEFSLAQRSDWVELRDAIGLRFNCTMGVYVEDRSFYRKAIEYLREHHASEQQDEVSGGTYRTVFADYTVHDLLSNIPNDYFDDMPDDLYDDF